ncbi:MAG TPA: tetratricopeptide repeat protein [Oscillatoriales cyanobacterium M59_W2019_021]|nr:tetratricopeptide repeat protein [Oscillatoriales cyanobacterium M4454_W2019_049]HIK49611.1 tetratricopeptide repeat protein [Oscillatoriales cyanobacterium M59_W2019_021]
MSSSHSEITNVPEKFERARQLQSQGDTSGAIAEYRSILEIDSENLAALHQLAQLSEGQGDFAAAVEHYQKSVEIDSEPPFWIYRHLGFALSQQERLEEAVEAYQKAIELNPKEAKTYSLLGQVRGKQGNFSGAIDSYQKAIELSNELPIWVYLNLGEALSQEKRFEEAIVAYEKASELEPENVGIRRLLDEATTQHELSRKTDNVSEHFDLARELQSAGQLEEALGEYQKVLEGDRNYLAALHQVAQIYESQGKWEEAIERYQKAIDLDANPPFWVYRHLGFALSQQERLDKAIEAYQRAIELNPEDGATQSLLKYVCKKKEELNGRSDTNPELQKLQAELPSIHEKLLEELRQSIDDEVERLNIEAEETDLPAEITYDDPVMDTVSKEFDREFYLSTYPDVREAGVDPVYHYCQTWSAEARNPTSWFNTQYYLEAHPDILEINVNPFWHYLVAGRAEGRCPQRPGGYRRDIIDTLVPPSEKTKSYSYPDTVFHISLSHLLAVLDKASENAKGFVIALSHDCYIKGVGGTQIFISDEQKKFNDRQYSYLHISPVMAKLTLAEDDLDFCLVQIIVNGAYVGVTNYHDLVETLFKITPNLPVERLLIVHCVLGHQVTGIIQLKKALDATNSYFWLHDYSSVCVGFNLLRNDIFYCGAPSYDSLACRVCIYGQERKSHLDKIHHLFTEIGFHVLAPSAFTLDLWQNSTSLPHLSAHVHEHCTLNMTAYKVVANSKVLRGTRDNPLRIAYVGYPVNHKGWSMFLNVLYQTRKLPYQFYHFASEGALQYVEGVENVAISVTPKSRSAMIEALSEKTIDIVLILSPWPETFSYAAHEAFASGASVIALRDSGNVAAAVKKKDCGIVVKDEEELIDYFRSNRVIKYARKRYAQGIEVGSLAHTGTTASFIFSNQEII